MVKLVCEDGERLVTISASLTSQGSSRKKLCLAFSQNRSTPSIMPSPLQIRHGCFCLIAACLLIQIAATSPVFPPLERNVEFQPTACWVSENQLKLNYGESCYSTSVEAAVHEGESWLRGLHNLSNWISRLSNEQETWPKLKFGWRTISGVLLAGIGAVLSSAGGLGGGAIFVPLFNLLLQFDAKTSAVLSNFMILGGSLANLFIYLRQHHPSLPHRPLIDFDVVMLLQPNMLLGISTGVILNVMLPDWVVTALLTVTLSYMTFHSFKGGIRRWKKETNQNRLRKSAKNCAPFAHAPDFHHDRSSSEDCSSDDESPSVTDPSTATEHEADHDNQETGNSRPNSLLSEKDLENVSDERLSQPILRKESSKVNSSPVDKAGALAFTWFAFFVVQVLRGGRENQGIFGIRACGLEYWLLTCTQIPLACGVTAWTIKRFYASHASRVNSEVRKEDGFVLRPESCKLFAWMAFVAGLLGGLLGIGGGMIINPLLLTVGMIPQVTAGTCASMVFFSSSMSVVQFWLMGRVPIVYALFAALLCSISSVVGVTLVHRAIHKYNRASLIEFCVTTVMGVSAVLMAGFGGLAVWRKYTSGAYMGFHYPC